MINNCGAPNRSASRPASNSTPANVSAVAPTSHCRTAGATSRSAPMAGSTIATAWNVTTMLSCPKPSAAILAAAPTLARPVSRPLIRVPPRYRLTVVWWKYPECYR
ncbi:hypothetical protein GCM10028864_09900 [Microlunatus parietis]